MVFSSSGTAPGPGAMPGGPGGGEGITWNSTLARITGSVQPLNTELPFWNISVAFYTFDVIMLSLPQNLESPSGSWNLSLSFPGTAPGLGAAPVRAWWWGWVSFFGALGQGPEVSS